MACVRKRVRLDGSSATVRPARRALLLERAAGARRARGPRPDAGTDWAQSVGATRLPGRAAARRPIRGILSVRALLRQPRPQPWVYLRFTTDLSIPPTTTGHVRDRLAPGLALRIALSLLLMNPLSRRRRRRRRLELTYSLISTKMPSSLFRSSLEACSEAFSLPCLSNIDSLPLSKLYGSPSQALRHPLQ
jgi:hypothetical protein